ncbi:MAG: MFS transporter [Clostridia bacterium]|nr:MFS transporter [Clostridia bacterium]
MPEKNKKFLPYVILFTLMYFTSYITRINYGAVIANIEEVEKISKELLSLAITGSFITYGIGQVISGYLGDRFQPKNLIGYAFLVTATMNLLIPFCTSPYQMTAIWCVNGFAQAFMWPPLVRIASEIFTPDEYAKATTYISFGGNFGTIAIYLIAPAIIMLASWRQVFYVTAGCAIVMFLLWCKFCPKITSKKKEVVPQEKISSENYIGRHPIFSIMMVLVMVAIALQGSLRDGITTWMPTFISESFNLGSKISILTGAILPIFGIFSIQLTSIIYRKKFQKNPLLYVGIIFMIGVASTLCLLLSNGKSVVLSVLFSACLSGTMHGANWVMVCILPMNFKKFGNISTVSGVLNACTYVGSALSAYGIAVLCENFGWTFTIVIWGLIALLGASICIGFSKKYKNRILK